jgi:hypothetical protein
MTLRSLLHGAAPRREQDAEAATLLAADIDNPMVAAGWTQSPCQCRARWQAGADGDGQLEK